MNENEHAVAGVAMIICLILGVGLGFWFDRPQTVTETVEVVKNEAEWTRLKSLDDQALDQCREFANLTSEAFMGLSEGNYEPLFTYTEEVQGLTEEMYLISEDRNEVLNKLGY